MKHDKSGGSQGNYFIDVPPEYVISGTRSSISSWNSSCKPEPYCKRNKHLDNILKEIGELHDKKNQDYAVDDNVYSNFEEAAVSGGISVYQVFRTMIGIKLARLNALTAKNKEPNFESISDTIIDLAVYACLYAAYYEEKNNMKEENKKDEYSN